MGLSCETSVAVTQMHVCASVDGVSVPKVLLTAIHGQISLKNTFLAAPLPTPLLSKQVLPGPPDSPMG